MCRRCVVCGKYATDNDCELYHYPKNKREALIWQRSMGAFETCTDTIQDQCCVCIKHIPQFVELAQKQAALMTTRCAEPMSRPSLNVLLLPGATLPSYCGNLSRKGTKDSNQDEDKLDMDIVVKEFSLKDCGVNFPDIDQTEVTVLRTSTQNDDELKNVQGNNEANEQCGDNGNMTDCTDVLLLSRSQNYSADTSCQCDLCAKLCPSTNSYSPNPEINYDFNRPLVACECERKARHELGELIKRQQNRIFELEYQLCRQTDSHYSMQQKPNGLYSEYGSLEPPEELNWANQPLPDEQQIETARWEESNYQQNSNTETTEGNRVRWFPQPSQNFETTEGTIKSSPEDNNTSLNI